MPSFVGSRFPAHHGTSTPHSRRTPSLPAPDEPGRPALRRSSPLLLCAVLASLLSGVLILPAFPDRVGRCPRLARRVPTRVGGLVRPADQRPPGLPPTRCRSTARLGHRGWAAGWPAPTSWPTTSDSRPASAAGATWARTSGWATRPGAWREPWASAPHRSNMLDPDFTQIGVAVGGRRRQAVGGRGLQPPGDRGQLPADAPRLRAHGGERIPRPRLAPQRRERTRPDSDRRWHRAGASPRPIGCSGLGTTCAWCTGSPSSNQPSVRAAGRDRSVPAGPSERAVGTGPSRFGHNGAPANARRPAPSAGSGRTSHGHIGQPAAHPAGPADAPALGPPRARSRRLLRRAFGAVEVYRLGGTERGRVSRRPARHRWGVVLGGRRVAAASKLQPRVPRWGKRPPAAHRR